jgi:Transglycosylase SLT domain
MAAHYPIGHNMKIYEIITEAVDKDVMQLQQELKAAGADLGNFGPKNDGVDGRLGSFTRRAAEKFPEIAAKYKDVLARSNSVDAQKIDTSTIQDPDFNSKLKKIANLLGVKASDLLAIMKQESGVNPHIQNSIGATGLIQFMPDTARRLGTTTSELAQMDGVQQLDYVYKYFKMTGVGNGTLGDLYMAVFMPKYIGYDDKHILGQSGAPGFSGKVYAQNRGLDRDKDGTITIADVKQSVQRFA